MRFKEFEVINELSMFDVAKLLGMPADIDTTEPTTKPSVPKTISVTNKTANNKPVDTEKTDTEKDADTSTKSANMPVKATAISRYLTSKGLDDAHRLGILANIQGESGFNPSAYVIDSNGLPSGGLFQHNGSRFKLMTSAAGSDWKSNWRAQIDFALSEKDGRVYVNTPFKNAAEATAWWVKHFEKPKYANVAINQRIGFLKNLA